jgi:hypothetical protein
MAEYKPNSHKSKAESTEVATTEEKKVKKVVSGKVSKKENNTRKFAGLFVSEDAANVKSYVLMDVLVPAIKKAISDIVTDGIDMILYGETRGKRSRSSGGVSYRSYYDDRDRRDRDRGRDRGGHGMSGRFDYEDIVFESRGDAELVREQMLDILDQYGMVTVADMYDLAGETAPYTASKYGWFNIRTAEVTRIRNGYILKLPKAMPID